jgi:peptidoglycan/LPS O-acetylase OafA/YrhL
VVTLRTNPLFCLPVVLLASVMAGFTTTLRHRKSPLWHVLPIACTAACVCVATLVPVSDTTRLQRSFDVLFVFGLSAPLALLVMATAARKGLLAALAQLRAVQYVSRWAPPIFLLSNVAYVPDVVAAYVPDSPLRNVSPFVLALCELLLTVLLAALLNELVMPRVTRRLRTLLQYRVSRDKLQEQAPLLARE